MSINVAGHPINLIVVFVAVLQVVAALCEAEILLGSKPPLRAITGWTFLAAIGAISTLVFAWVGISWIGLDSKYLGAGVLIGISSGIGGGFLPRWVSDLADARTQLPEIKAREMQLLSAISEAKKEERIAQQAKRTLQSERIGVRDRIDLLQAQSAISRGRAARENELLHLISRERDISKLLASAQRKLRNSQRALKSFEEEYADAASHVYKYEQINRQFDKKFSIFGTVKHLGVIVTGTFVLGFFTGLLLLKHVALAISIGLLFALISLPTFQLIPMLMFWLGSLAKLIGSDRHSKALFSPRGFLVAFCLLLILQEMNFLLPPASPSWANGLFALILALGSGVAGGFSRAVGNAVGRLTKTHFAAVALVCHCTLALLPLTQVLQ